MNLTENGSESMSTNISESLASHKWLAFEMSPIYKGFQVTILVIAVLISIIGNSLSIVVIHKANHIKTTTKIPMFSLAVCYIMVNIVFGIPFIGATAVNTWPYGQTMCFVLAFGMNWFYACSACLLFTLNLDRYIAVTRPLRYHSLISNWKISMLVLTAWLFSFSVTCFNAFLPYQRAFFKHDYHFCFFDPYTDEIVDIIGMINLLLLIVFPITATIVIYCKIYNISKFHAQQIALLEQSMQRNAEKQRTLDTKAAKAFLLVTAGFVLAWLPVVIAIGYEYAYKKDPPILPWWCGFFGTVSTSINVVIYYWRNEAFRRPARKMMMRWMRVAPEETSMWVSSIILE
ncbi:trace amine-associated receptor 365-like [Amphiura filiformis]|uniref:trace amine-associated receptor 365-like n=1 Tax=Amphiura filiformis TaxID=82378 RepID=UPI003B228CE3